MKNDEEKRTVLTMPIPSPGQQMLNGTAPALATRGALNVDCSAHDSELAAKVVQRVAEILKLAGLHNMGYTFDPVICYADIINVHCNGCPLRLLAWLMSTPSDFMEDFNGINRHVNRVTGGINGEWRPRFAETKQ